MIRSDVRSSSPISTSSFPNGVTWSPTWCGSCGRRVERRRQERDGVRRRRQASGADPQGGRSHTGQVAGGGGGGGARDPAQCSRDTERDAVVDRGGAGARRAGESPRRSTDREVG